MSRTEKKQSEKEQIEGIFLNVSIELQYTCMQVKRKTKNVCPEQQNVIWKRQDVYKQLASQMQESPEQQKTSWKRPDVYKQLASQMRDLSSINDSIYMQVKCKTK